MEASVVTQYERKFASLIKLCNEAMAQKIDVVVVHHPEVLGNNYAEIIESLNRLSAAQLKLAIVPPDERASPDLPAKRRA
jgi:hypothetical protein